MNIHEPVAPTKKKKKDVYGLLGGFATYVLGRNITAAWILFTAHVSSTAVTIKMAPDKNVESRLKGKLQITRAGLLKFRPLNRFGERGKERGIMAFNIKREKEGNQLDSINN